MSSTTTTGSKKEYNKLYMRRWREQNKDKNRVLNKKCQKNYIIKNKKKSIEIKKKYEKQRFNCLFCNKSQLFYIRNRHFKTKIHKKNVLKFNKILQNYNKVNL